MVLRNRLLGHRGLNAFGIDPPQGSFVEVGKPNGVEPDLNRPTARTPELLCHFLSLRIDASEGKTVDRNPDGALPHGDSTAGSRKPELDALRNLVSFWIDTIQLA